MEKDSSPAPAPAPASDKEKESHDDVTIPEELPSPNFRKDFRSILLLLFLYVLQGIPLGLIVTVPFLLQAKGVPYKEQGRFSLAFWPFSFKVIYAPIVDAIYWRKLGRRKSWLVPLQYLIALFLLILAFTVDNLFETVNVPALTAMFFILNFLAASQDVAVDGWALTMLSPENVAYASTCNALGQTLGSVMGYSGFLALNSAKFANKFRAVPEDRGLVTLPQFLLFWSIVFAVSTTLVLFFKQEKKESAEVDSKHMNVLSSYRSLWKILRLRNVQILAVFLLTVKIGMAAEALNRLKLVEVGIPKETLAFFSIPLIPVKLLLPILVSKWTVGPSPMRLYINLIPITYVFCVVFPLIIFWLPTIRDANGEYSTWVYFFLFGVMALELVPAYARFVLYMGFAAKIADPAIGGTYMTLINTITNVGGMWPSTLALWVVDYVSIPLRNDCPTPSTGAPAILNGTFSDYDDESVYSFANETGGENVPYSYTTESAGGGLAASVGALSRCISQIDGYYIESAFCIVIGVLWLVCWGRSTILRLQALPRHSWKIVKATG